MSNSSTFRKIIIVAFILVPIMSSVISAHHIISFYTLGNPSWLALSLAIAIELGSIASFLTLSILDKLNKSIVWSVFIILFMMQIVGNMYFSYDFISDKMNDDPLWLNSFKEMIEFFFSEMEISDVKMYLTMLVSWPIPLISVFLLKSAVDYLKPDNEEKEEKSLTGKEKEDVRKKLMETSD